MEENYINGSDYVCSQMPSLEIDYSINLDYVRPQMPEIIIESIIDSTNRRFRTTKRAR